MRSRMAVVAALLVTMVPIGAHAQLRIGGMSISVGDVERAVRVGTMVYEATREPRRTSRAGRTTGGTTSRTSGRRSGASARAGARAIRTGDEYVGVPYKWGGNTPSEGFDCSGFVKYVFADVGVSLPRTSRQQARVGEWIPADVSVLRQGDLMFFASNGSRIDHVAMYAGNNRILHSSSSGGGVRYDDLDTRRGRWFADHLVTVRRVADDRGSLVDALALARLTFDYFDPPDRAPRR